MSYLENSELNSISLFLTEREVGDAIINGKIELYNVSPVKLPCVEETSNERMSFDHIASFPPEIEGRNRPRSNSCEIFPQRPKNAPRSSSLGDLSAPSSRKLFLDLISTLNESFPDYDFHATKLHQFVEKDVSSVMRVVNNSLAEITEENPTFLQHLWDSIDRAVGGLRRCEVFSYVPDNEDVEDPFSSHGSIWSFNHFFFNPQKLRICYVTVMATRYYYYMYKKKNKYY